MSSGGVKKVKSKINYSNKNTMNPNGSDEISNGNNANIEEDNKTERQYSTFRENSEDNNNKQNLIDILDKLNFTKKNSKMRFEGSSYEFREKIDELNLKFYIETEKYMNNQIKDNNCIGNLFAILFKEISLYSDELDNVSRSNRSSIRSSSYDKANILEFETKNKLIQSLKESNKNLENRLSKELEKNNNLLIEIDRLKKENDALKQQHFSNNNCKRASSLNKERFSDLTKADSNISNENAIRKKGKVNSISVFDNNNNLLGSFSDEKWTHLKMKSKAELYIGDVNEYFLKNPISLCNSNKNDVNDNKKYMSTKCDLSGKNSHASGNKSNSIKGNKELMLKAKKFLTKEKIISNIMTSKSLLKVNKK